jgi:Winged helix DNA-binding domain
VPPRGRRPGRSGPAHRESPASGRLADVPARPVDAEERRARLAVRHRLVPSRRTDDVVAIADDLVALHSSDPVTVYLSVLARMCNPVLAAVEKALYDDRTLVRHHAMRRTLWVAGHENIRLAHAATTVDLHRVQHRMLAAALSGAGVTDAVDWIAAGRAAVLDVLADGAMTARDLGKRLPDLAVPVLVGTGRQATTVAAHTRLLLVLGFAGDVVRGRPTGTWINGQYRWAAADRWIPGGVDVGLDKRAAAAGLARRWLRAFGPGTRADLQWWAGWTAATTTRALADVDAVEVDLNGEAGFVLPDDVEPAAPAEPWVALLPGLDPTTMGWKDRSWYLDPGVAAAVFDRNGNGGPTVWVDGRIVGSWVQRRDGTIAVRLLADVDPTRRTEIDDAAVQLQELLGDVRFSVRFPAPVQAALL